MNQSELDFALKKYGEAMVMYAEAKSRVGYNSQKEYDNMIFWQNHAWMAAEKMAQETAWLVSNWQGIDA